MRDRAKDRLETERLFSAWLEVKNQDNKLTERKDWWRSGPQTNSMLALSQFRRWDQDDIDKLESGFAKLRQTRNRQGKRWRGTQLTRTMIVRGWMMFARGLGLWFTRALMMLWVQVRASHARNAQHELARNKHNQCRQNPRPEMQTSSVAFELADNPSHFPKF